MTDDGETGAEDITNQILNDPEKLQEFFQSMMSVDNHEARVTLGSIDELTEQRRSEIKDMIQEEVERAISRGTLHRFSGFLDYEP